MNVNSACWNSEMEDLISYTSNGMFFIKLNNF
jgi:hypothetical protein